MPFIIYNLILITIGFSQINWAYTYGDSVHADDGWSIDQTIDGGFIMGGMSIYKAVLKKIDYNGQLEWSRIYENSDDDNIKNVKQTSDGGYISTGFSINDDTWDYEAWTFKLDSMGEIESIIFALVGIFKKIESNSPRYYKIVNNFKNSFKDIKNAIYYI